MRSRKLTSLALPALLVAAVAFAASTKPTVDSIGDKVMCQCGCVASMNNCPHKDNPAFVCYPTWREMKAMIQKDIDSGRDETAILQALAARYGVQVLASPPAKGFNLSVWILPGVGLLAGLGLVVFIVKRWRQPAPAAPAAAPATVDPKVLAAMEEEMKKVGRS